MPSQSDEIKEKLDIVQVISEYLELKKVGANYRANCPFHSEKTPSFYVSSSKQIFKCFGCQKAGDVFTFLMELEGIEFPEALQILAKKTGVEIKKEPPQQRTEKQRLYEICNTALRFFEKQLKTADSGREAKEYLKKRGIKEKTIKEWHIGWAPSAWRGLSDFLISRGYKREEIIKAGLAIRSEERIASPYDRFRERIMFPIFDLQNNAIGFGGRTFKVDSRSDSHKSVSAIAKYINTPNTLIYDKSMVLFGLNIAKMKIREEDEVVLVEGYTDVILSAQSGIQNVVSTSGTALTSHQLRILSRYTKNISLCFDMDIAGEAATKKGIDIAQIQGFNIKIVSLPENKDPADVASENSEEWRGDIKEAEEIINFYFKQSFERFDKNTVEGKKKISEIILPFVARLQNKIEEAHWIGELSQKLSLQEEIIWQEVEKIRGKQSKEYSAESLIPSGVKLEDKKRKRKLEERLLMFFLKFPEEFSKVADRLPVFSFQEGAAIVNFLKEGGEAEKDLNNFISELDLQFDIENEKWEIKPKEEIRFCIDSILKIARDEDFRKIQEELKEAETENPEDEKKIAKILDKINNLKKEQGT